MKTFTFILLMILLNFYNGYSQDFWEKTAGPDTTTIWSLVINSSGDIFAGTNMDGVFRSTDNGNNWTNLGIMNYDIRSMVISSSGDILVNTDQWGGVYRSSDNGNNWTNIGFPHFNFSIAIDDADSVEYIYVGTAALGTWRTTDNGANWEQIVNGMTASQVNSLVINTRGDVFAGTLQGGIFRSANNGESWVQINQGLTENYILSLAINTSGEIFAGTSGGGAFRSTDNGENWVQINQGLYGQNGQGYYVFSLAINSNGDIFAGTAEGVFRSTDNGENWVQINQGLTNLGIRSLAINSSGGLFAGTDGGIFRSINSTLPVELTSFSATVNKNNLKLNWRTSTEVNNYGFEIERSIKSANNTVWEKIGFVEGNGNSNSPKEYSYLDINPIGGSKFIYRLKQIDNDGQFEYSKIVEVELVPTEFSLYQNYPNPFNPATKIRYQLPNESKVVIKIYNILGSEVKELLNEQKEAGIYEVEFSAIGGASNLSSGTYIYKISAENFVQTKKMILLK